VKTQSSRRSSETAQDTKNLPTPLIRDSASLAFHHRQADWVWRSMRGPLPYKAEKVILRNSCEPGAFIARHTFILHVKPTRNLGSSA
jgi:hypothetical protein